MEINLATKALLGIILALVATGGTTLTRQRGCARSTEELHSSVDARPQGVFARIRESLDAAYHTSYTIERQQWQDAVLLHEWNKQTRRPADETKGQPTTDAFRPWMVFTAGVMGAGKSHTIQRLHELGLFPRHNFVVSDPDVYRHRMPEFHRFAVQCPERAGLQTRKEAGMMSEILVQYALHHGKSVLQDGTLRDWQWYQHYIQQLRREVLGLRVAILHVTAPLDVILKRARNRATQTGRIVPEHLLRENFEQVPHSVEQLTPFVDVVVQISNNDDIELQSMDADKFEALWL